MEIRCTAHTHVKTLNPLLTFITLQHACSAFSPEIKLPQYFKQYSKGFEIAIKTAKLNVPTFNISNFRIWQPFNLSKISDAEKKQLKKLEPAPTISMEQLRAQISGLGILKQKLTNLGFTILEVAQGLVYYYYL